MLSSDPTGSGLDGAHQVVVSGTAVCPGELVTSPSGHEAYWSMLFDRQPDNRRYVDLAARWLMDWYYLRLLITVTPTGVTTRPPLSARPPTGPSPQTRGSPCPRRHPRALHHRRPRRPGRFRSSLAHADSGPGHARGIPGGTAGDGDVVAGLASLLVHRHDDRLAGLYKAPVRGELRRSGDDGWLLVPHRVIEPSGDGGARTLRIARRATNTYLRKRNLDRPKVDWPALKALATTPATRAGKS
ncbi:pyridoxamine 5'-phosphate oxidase family protein [Streptomyces spiralis]